MKELRYEKPAVKFVSLRNREQIAATCWGLDLKHPHAQEIHYYDVEGEGYVSFQVIGGKSGGNNCSDPDAYNIKYYRYEGDSPVDGTKYEGELEAALVLKGGNGGQPYQGLYTDFPQNPDPSWS